MKQTCCYWEFFFPFFPPVCVLLYTWNDLILKINALYLSCVQHTLLLVTLFHPYYVIHCSQMNLIPKDFCLLKSDKCGHEHMYVCVGYASNTCTLLRPKSTSEAAYYALIWITSRGNAHYVRRWLINGLLYNCKLVKGPLLRKEWRKEVLLCLSLLSRIL